jgi:hypothetical protein
MGKLTFLEDHRRPLKKVIVRRITAKDLKTGDLIDFGGRLYELTTMSIIDNWVTALLKAPGNRSAFIQLDKDDIITIQKGE